MSEARVLVGVDGCKGGWVAAIEAAGQIRVETFPTFSALADDLHDDSVLVVDIPIGLPDHCFGGRGPERAIRPLLGKRRSSVFEVPSRDVVHLFIDPSIEYVAGYNLAKEKARATSTPPRAFARQGFGLFPKIREVDTYLVRDPSRASRIFESHPELAFRRLKGEALEFPKKEAQGIEERVSLLVSAGFKYEQLTGPLPSRTGRDDLLDACAMLTVARRVLAGTVERYPPEPVFDRFGLPIAIHV